MAHIVTDAALGAAPLAPYCAFDERARALMTAATSLLPLLETGRPVESAYLRDVMTVAFGGTDAEGAWDWKSAYDACEVAQILFLRRFGPAILSRSGSRSHSLALIERVSALMPTHTRRSETSQALQQYSTPAGLSFVAVVAASIGAGETVLEPSAGTGMLAIQAELAGAQLVLNELAEGRAALLSHLFSGVAVSGHDAASIDDRLPISARPSVILMNPPFSAVAHVERTMKDAALRHIASALARLENGGRLVVITGAGCSPDAPAWRDAFIRLQGTGHVVFTAAIDGKVYRKHGTTIDTRLTVIDKLPASDPTTFIPSAGTAPDTATLLKWVEAQVPPRGPIAPMPGAGLHCASSPSPVSRAVARTAPINPVVDADAPELSYSTADWSPPEGQLGDSIYERYGLQSVVIPGALPHPTPLVQSASMASVAPPKPAYFPHLPEHLLADGVLSDAQLESVIYAGEAHSGHLAGSWTVDETWDLVSAAAEENDAAIRFRRGWFLGDGTGAGKGRQVAGIILDNWLKGRRRSLWVSVSDRLLEDAQRDWSALGQERLLVTPLSRYRQGTPIKLAEGILFTTYATLRSQERGGRRAGSSRSSNGLAVTLTVSSSLTRRTPWPMPQAARARAAMSQPRSRAGRACGCNMPCPMPASSMSRPPVPRRCRISPMPSGSGCGAAKTFLSPRAPISWPRSRMAASQPWRCWPAI